MASNLKTWASNSGTGAWDESKHPRDATGRFGGGGGSEPQGAGKVVTSGGGVAATGSRSDTPLEPRIWTDKRPAGLPEQTIHEHYTAHPDKGGVPKAERKMEVHDPIVKAALDHARQPAPNEQKIAVLTMGGGPASGKGTIIDNLGLKNSHDFVHVDPDKVKEALPEYKAALDRKGTFKGAAAMVHEESSHVAKRIRDEAVEQGKHVIIDGTGANAEKFKGLIDHLKSKGYEVHVHMPHIEKGEAFKRMESRADRSGRSIPEKFFHETYDKINANSDTIRNHADNFTIYDAHNAHKPIMTKVNGKETVHDKAAMARYDARNKK